MVQMKRHTKSARNRRRSHQALKTTTLTVCPHCQQAVLPHRACQFCGYYKQRAVIKIKSVADKKHHH